MLVSNRKHLYLNDFQATGILICVRAVTNFEYPQNPCFYNSKTRSCLLLCYILISEILNLIQAGQLLSMLTIKKVFLILIPVLSQREAGSI